MKFLRRLPAISGLSELDRQIEKLRGLRNSYYEANVAYYGREIADMLNG